LAGAGYDLLDVRIFRGGGRLQVRVYLDTAEGGITLDQCAEASRTVGMLLEEADLFSGRYVIEVSSPGIRRPLRTAAHFVQAVGQNLDVKTAAGRFKGRLAAFADGKLTIETGGADAAPVTIRLGEIREANLDPEFDAQALINADRRRRKEEKRRRREERGGGKRGRPRSGTAANGAEEDEAGDPD
jgi:ribosome maturation factor RimP